jgi:hypothetical protein
VLDKSLSHWIKLYIFCMIPLRELLVPTIKPSHWRLDASHRTQTVTDLFLTSSPRGLHGTQTVTDLILTSSPRGLHGTQTHDWFISYELSEGASWDSDSWSIYFLRALRESFMGPKLVTDFFARALREGLKGPRLMTNLFLTSSARGLHKTQTRDRYVSYELS